MADALLRADERDDLLVAEGDAEPALVPVRDSLAHRRQTVRLRIAMVRRVLGGPRQRVEDVRRRGDVRVSDAEADHVGALGALLRDLSADFEKQVRGKLVEPVGKLHGPSTAHWG